MLNMRFHHLPQFFQCQHSGYYHQIRAPQSGGNSDKLFVVMKEYKTLLISDVVTKKVDVRNIVVEKTVDDTEEEMDVE